MAKKETKVIPPKSVEDQIADAKARLIGWDSTPLDLVPLPTRQFEVGEQVVLGNLKNVVVVEKLHQGKAYVISCIFAPLRDSTPVPEYRAEFWFELEKKPGDTKGIPSLFSEYRRIPGNQSDISGLMCHLTSGGITIDPRYQRDYVWSEANKDALLESIFERLDIGSVLFVRHAGFNHKAGTGHKDYCTLDGRTVSIAKKDDFTMAIVDGQQRLTTIFDFVLGRRAYKGVYFSQMSPRDQGEFMRTSITVRIVEEETTSEKEILRMFLQANRGVPQAPEHLAKVQALYDAL